VTPATIRAERLRLGLTQSQAAALIGVCRVAWARYESGSRTLPAASWRLWRHVAGVERIPFPRRTAPALPQSVCEALKFLP
jgi:transcriptional regulator with XRE-family HTH domain